MDYGQRNRDFLDGDLMDDSLEQNDIVVLRISSYPILVDPFHFNDANCQRDDLLIGMAFLGGLVPLLREDNLDLKLVSRTFEHSRDINWLHEYPPVSCKFISLTLPQTE